MDWKLFGTTFALIFFAEFPDKTAFATMMMATRANPFAVFLGSSGAFLIQCVVAVAFGGLISLLPEKPVHIVAGVLFLLFAFLMWRKKDEEAESSSDRPRGKTFFQTAFSSFVVIFIAEWGDLTQLATATLAAKYQARGTIFFASLLALVAATAVSVVVGHQAKRFLNPKLVQKIAAMAFTVVGLFILVSALRE